MMELQHQRLMALAGHEKPYKRSACRMKNWGTGVGKTRLATINEAPVQV